MLSSNMIDDPCLAPIRPTDCDLSDEYRPILVSILVERQTHVKNPRPPPVKKHNDDLRAWLRRTAVRFVRSHSHRIPISMFPLHTETENISINESRNVKWSSGPIIL